MVAIRHTTENIYTAMQRRQHLKLRFASLTPQHLMSTYYVNAIVLGAGLGEGQGTKLHLAFAFSVCCSACRFKAMRTPASPEEQNL